MNFYLKQHVFTFGDRFSVYDRDENIIFSVEGEVFTFGKKLHVYDSSEEEIAYIYQKPFSMRPRYFIESESHGNAEVVKNFTFIFQKYSVSDPELTVEGDFLSHEYSAEMDGEIVFTVSKVWFSWGDAYEINIDDKKIDSIMALCVVLVIDACNDSN